MGGIGAGSDGAFSTQKIPKSALSELTNTTVMSRPPAGMSPSDGDTSPGFAPILDAHAETLVDAPAFDQLRRTMPIDRAGSFPNPAHPAAAAPAGAPQARVQGTLLGVARPGIAPLSASSQLSASSRAAATPAPIAGSAASPRASSSKGAPPSYQPFEELGATAQVPRKVQQQVAKELARARVDQAHPLGRRRVDRAARIEPAAAPRSNRRPLILVGAAVVVVAAAVLVALFWPRGAPIEAQVRAAEGGVEVLDLTCSSCPDGTVIKSRTTEATVKDGRATLPLPAPLPIGDSTMKLTIDRPSNGRDETVTIPARVAYRIRPDLTTLEADAPSIQVVVEAMDGATVVLDGEPVVLREGRAVKTIDVRKDIAGADGDPAAQLTRKISFSVTPPNSDEEKGVVAVAVPILPLTIEAPGRATVTEKPNFFLAGRTTPGAEIVVAGRSIGVAKDGTFSQTMNISSIGATEIEIRAKMTGRAPRLVKVSVERVNDLAAAARSFENRKPITLAEAIASPAEARNKPIIVVGEVIESTQASGMTTVILRPTQPSCGDKCVVRLVQGRVDLGLARGAIVKAFGFMNGVVSHSSGDIPDIDVSFSSLETPAVSPNGTEKRR